MRGNFEAGKEKGKGKEGRGERKEIKGWKGQENPKKIYVNGLVVLHA